LVTDPNRRYCDAHQAQEWKRQDERRGSSTQRGYGAQWREIRDRVLADRPLCERCGRKRATLVHHILPKQQGGSDDPINLQALCDLCHAQIHAAGGQLFGGRAREG
jgi:5-methylcytosine-specific restriction protein A